MILKDKLKTHHIILASASPRRQAFFKDLGLAFEIRLKPIEETFPEHLEHHEISDYLAELKAAPFENELEEKDILVTSDTIVWHEGKALGKPLDEQDAYNMIRSLSGQTHDVITSVCLKSKYKKTIVNCTTKVTFKDLTDEEIWFYITNYKPMDKAGAYGIQEWIGYIGVTHIEGSFFNVVGMPVHLVYEALINFLKTP